MTIDEVTIKCNLNLEQLSFDFWFINKGRKPHFQAIPTLVTRLFLLLLVLIRKTPSILVLSISALTAKS